MLGDSCVKFLFQNWENKTKADLLDKRHSPCVLADFIGLGFSSRGCLLGNSCYDALFVFSRYFKTERKLHIKQTVKDAIAIADYAIKANDPLITIPVLLILVFIGYCLAKKFFDTSYVTTSKEARESQHQLIVDLQQEIERLNRKIEILEEENNQLKEKIAQTNEKLSSIEEKIEN